MALITASAIAEDKNITIAAGGRPALILRVPESAEVGTKGEKTTIQTKSLRIYIWAVPGASTVAEVVPRVGEIIKSEFLEYIVESSESLKVAGREALLLMGKGEEADDNDPGTADVVIFSEGSEVFAACVHGEGREAAKERPDLLKVLGSVARP